MKRFAVALMALGLFAGLAPEAHADPVIHGRIATSGVGLFSACSMTCRDFFAAGCPDQLAQPDGVDRSIVDISGWAKQTLTFEWSASSTAAYAALAGAAGSQEYGSQVFFYIVSSCDPPQRQSFALTSRPTELTKTVTIPDDAKWLIVETDTAQNLTWSATDNP